VSIVPHFGRRLGRKHLKMGYWKVKKTPAIPSEEVLAQLELRPLDYKKYARTKNGDKR
jgi:hypothetical protein